MLSLAAATGALANWSAVLTLYVVIPVILGLAFLQATNRVRRWIETGSPTLNGMVYERLGRWLPDTHQWVGKWSAITLAAFTLWIGVQMTDPLRHQAEQLRSFSQGLTSLKAGTVVGLTKDWKCSLAPVPKHPKELLTFLFLGVQRYPLRNSAGRTLNVLLPSGLTAEEVNVLLNREQVFRSQVDRRALVAAPTLKAVQSNLGRYPSFASVLIWIAWLLYLPGMFALSALALFFLQLPAAVWDRWIRHLLCHAYHGRIPLEYERVRPDDGRVVWEGKSYRAHLWVPLQVGYLTNVLPLLPAPVRPVARVIQSVCRFNPFRLPPGVVFLPHDLRPEYFQDRRPAA